MAVSYPVKVNDTEFQMESQKVVSHDILELAEKKGAMPGKPEEYALKSLTTDDRLFGRDEEVDLSVDNRFITLLNGPANVA